jgi:hypothetical protein
MALVSEGGERSEKLGPLFAQSVSHQESLVYRDGCLSAFRDGDRDKKDVTRNVTRDIDAGNAALLRGGINLHPSFVITFAA